MKIEIFKNGYLLENCYLIHKQGKALIIDPGNKIPILDNFIQKNELKVLAILITHYHFDHIEGLDYYKFKYNTEVIDFRSGKHIKIDNFDFEIIQTFGHTMDSVSFYFKKENIMFTGDFLFKETIGNYEQENEEFMRQSIKNILVYPPLTIIYPGHDDSTRLDHEMKFNPYLRDAK